MLNIMNENGESLKLSELFKEFKSICSNPAVLNRTLDGLFDVLVDEIAVGIIFETHKDAKTGSVYDDELESNIALQAINAPDLDIFGQHPKKSLKCNCPKCERPIAASRFARHLEECMGMGRNRSKRLAAINKGYTYSSLVSDDEDDIDRKSGDKKRKKRDRKNGVKKTKTTPKKNGEPVNVAENSNSSTSESMPQYMSYENMNDKEKKNLLIQICGVVSEHTKKNCTRSLRCAQQTDEKKRALRSSLLIADNTGAAIETGNVDIEGDEDCNEQTGLRDLFQDISNTSSPVDSASTSNSSTSSNKRDKSNKTKRNGRRDRNSPSQFGVE